MLIASANDPDAYTYEDVARFGIRLFLRQIGLDDERIARLTEEGKRVFDSLPLDNRYLTDFAYDDKYVTKIEEA